MIKQPEDRAPKLREGGQTTLDLQALADLFRRAMSKRGVGAAVHGATKFAEPTDRVLEIIAVDRAELEIIAIVPTSRTNGFHVHLYASRSGTGVEYTIIGFRGWMSPGKLLERRVKRFRADVAAAESERHAADS